MPLIDKPGFYYDITPAQYFAEPCPAPALTSGTIKALTYSTPKEAAWQHPALAGGDAVATSDAAKRMGDVCHQLALGKGRGYAVLPFADFRTKEARAAKEEAEAAGLTPIKEAEFEDAQHASQAMFRRIVRTFIQMPSGKEPADYATETVIAWQEDTPSGPIWCRAMLDVWCEPLAAILDPKFSRVLSASAWETHAVRMGWDLQGAWYMRGVANLRPDLAPRLRFINPVVDPRPPYPSRAFEADKATIYSCAGLIDTAVETWGKCLAADSWPDYPDEITTWSARGFTLGERAALMEETDNG